MPQGSNDSERYVAVSDDERVQRYAEAIMREAATFEHDFPAGPGEVVSVSDAAHVAARVADTEVIAIARRAARRIVEARREIRDLVAEGIRQKRRANDAERALANCGPRTPGLAATKERHDEG